MRLPLRYCQHCRAKALTPKSRRKAHMAAGWIYRRNHDLCARCFREASAASARRWRNLPGLPFDAAPLRAA